MVHAAFAVSYSNGGAHNLEALLSTYTTHSWVWHNLNICPRSWKLCHLTLLSNTSQTFYPATAICTICVSVWLQLNIRTKQNEEEAKKEIQLAHVTMANNAKCVMIHCDVGAHFDYYLYTAHL